MPDIKTRGPWKCARLVAIFLVTLTAGIQAQTAESDEGTNRELLSLREREASVLFSRAAGSILDVVERVQFSLVDDDLQLREVWFRRMPYQLSDGTQLSQTHDFETSVYVRQIVEHPFADTAVVVYPVRHGEPSDTVGRLFSMAEIAEMNPNKEVFAIRETPDGTFRAFRTSHETAASWAASDLEAPALSGDAIALFAAGGVLSQYETVSPGTGSGSSRGEDGGQGRQVAQVLLEDLEQGGQSTRRILDGQGLLIVGEIELAVQRAVSADPRDPQDLIENLNPVLDRFATIVGSADLRRLVFDSDDKQTLDARAALRAIDGILSTETEGIFLRGIAEIRALFTDGFPPAEAESGATLTLLLDRMADSSIVLVEAGEASVYEIIRMSLEQSSANVVIMSSGELGPEHPVPSFAVPNAVVHQDLREDALSGMPGEINRWLAIESARLQRVMTRMEPDTVVVTQRKVADAATLVGIALRLGQTDPQTSFYVLPTTEIGRTARVVDSLLESRPVEPVEASVLRRWAIVVQTAGDL